jgi:DNA invertase Pin-like site-specific DNA recombinase
MPIAYSYVRFSSAEQAKGGSYNRQIAQAQNYAQSHGLQLDSTTVFDRGVSAFKGKNRTVGALSKFLERVDSGDIKPGSYLLIENLDRISREEIDSAQETIKKILRAGIVVVTLMDGRIYDKKSINDPYALIQMILIGARAHEESETKSKRCADAWNKKRAAAAKGQILSPHLPWWLTIKDNKIVPISDRVNTIRRIYSMAKNGFGYTRIIQALNQEKTPPARSKTWAVSTMQTILHNKAVIGECQPYKMIGDGYSRIPDGPPIPHYFPAIISEKDFFLIQTKKGVRGPLTTKAYNLFPSLIKCGFCGERMTFKKRSEWEYMLCSHAQKGAGCHYIGIRYKDVESLVLDNCAQRINIKSKNDDIQIEIETINDRIKGAETAIKEKEKQLQKLMLSFADTTGTLKENYNRLLQNITADIDRLKNDLDADRPLLVQRQQAKDGIKNKLQAVVDLAGMRKSLETRLQLRTSIHDVIDKIIIYPAGATLKNDEFVADKPKPNAEVLRIYQVFYKDGRNSFVSQSVKLSYYKKP